MAKLNNNLEFIFNENKTVRLDMFLSQKMGLSRNAIQKLINNDFVLVNDQKVKNSYKLEINDRVIVIENFSINEEKKSFDINFDLNIVFEDNNYLIINKQRGIVVHPSLTTKGATLVDALLARGIQLSDINGKDRLGIVHRIDKNTTGLLIIAKNNNSHLFIQEQIRTKQARRIYLGLVDGNIKEDEGVIDKAIGRDSKNRKIMSTKNGLRDAVTKFKVIERFGQYTLVEFSLMTGRTHQIRAHAKSINHPLVGDKEYGGSNKFNVDGQLLHAYKLILISPTTRKECEYMANLPEDFENVLNKLKK